MGGGELQTFHYTVVEVHGNTMFHYRTEFSPNGVYQWRISTMRRRTTHDAQVIQAKIDVIVT